MLLEVRNIKKSFGGLMALADVSLTVDNGEILGLIGPNGSGKTTFFNLISGFYGPEKGKVNFRGQDITGLRPDVIANFGLVRTFQIPKPLPELTALENVRIAAFLKNKTNKAATEIAWEILGRIGLAEKGHVISHKLTYGQKKILELGRALATRPKMLCLDEIMSGINSKESMEIVDLLRKINQEGITLILIEHNMSAVLSIAQRIVVLNYGVKIADGPADEVIKSERVIEAYLGKDEFE